jgi:hypothetical protein
MSCNSFQCPRSSTKELIYLVFSGLSKSLMVLVFLHLKPTGTLGSCINRSQHSCFSRLSRYTLAFAIVMRRLQSRRRNPLRMRCTVDPSGSTWIDDFPHRAGPQKTGRKFFSTNLYTPDQPLASPRAIDQQAIRHVEPLTHHGHRSSRRNSGLGNPFQARTAISPYP